MQDPTLESTPERHRSRAEERAVQLERAVALEHAGAWDSAASIYRRLFRHSVEQGDVAAMVDALYGQARTYRELGRHEEAEDLAQLCREIASRNSVPRMAARALNLYAVLRFSQGDLEEARTLYKEAVEQARDAGDDQLMGFACQNLGVIANIRGELREAQLLYIESVGASVRSGDRTSAAMVYNNLGMVCTDLEEYLEAEIYFERGIEMAERIPDVPMLARLYANRAEPMIRVGELVRARGTLDKAEVLARPLRVPATLATIARFRAMIAAAEGDLAEAERQLTSSLAIAAGAGLRLARAEALEELAGVYAALDRGDEARTALNGAREAYMEVGAARDAARLADRLA